MKMNDYDSLFKRYLKNIVMIIFTEELIRGGYVVITNIFL